MALTDRLGSIVDRGMAAGNYGRWLALKERAAGLRLLRRGIELLVESDMRSGVSFMIDSLAELAALGDEPERAAHLFGFADSLRAAVGALPIPALEMRRARYTSLLEERLGPERTAEESQLGAAFQYEDGIEESLALADALLERAGSSTDLSEDRVGR
jgi:hypothetical protein